MGLCATTAATADGDDHPGTIVAVKVAPRKVGDGQTSKLHEERKLERQTSGNDLSLKEALTNVFQFTIINKYGPIRKRTSRETLLLEKIDYVIVVRGEVSHLPGLPDVESEEFEAQANAIFERIDTNHDGKMTLDEFIFWYMNSGPEAGVRGSGRGAAADGAAGGRGRLLVLVLDHLERLGWVASGHAWDAACPISTG